MQQTLLQQIQETFNSFQNNLNDSLHNGLQGKRQAALQHFLELGFPTSALEDWKYSNPAKIVEHIKSIASPQKTAAVHSINVPPAPFESNVVVLYNGQYIAEKSAFLDKSLQVCSLENALEQAKNTAVHEVFNQIADSEQAAWVALNTAFAQGVWIQVPPHTSLQYPVYLLFLYDNPQAQQLRQSRCLVHIADHSEAVFYEEHRNLGTTALYTNQVTEIRAADHSTTEYVQIQNEASQAAYFGSTNTAIAADAVFKIFTLSLKGNWLRNDLNLHLTANNASCYLNGLYVADEKQFMDNHTFVNHIQPNCYSNEIYKGIATDKAKTVFNGKIKVHIDAQKTNAYQQNRNILLSDTAQMFAKPQLEIFADDVKCSHGCTIGQLNEAALFYMRARGISEASARRLLLQGFASEVVHGISHAALRDYALKLIGEKMVG
ncbi:MAG: Fe-S cluster assembly protein SufD [Sphingobacteriales bacterium]|nr:Fe-S cluster assembly protein SufD [Sphingobacteriales bacterium]